MLWRRGCQCRSCLARKASHGFPAEATGELTPEGRVGWSGSKRLGTRPLHSQRTQPVCGVGRRRTEEGHEAKALGRHTVCRDRDFVPPAAGSPAVR